MSVAIRTITRLQDADDVNVTPAVGVDEYLLTYDHDTAKFVLRAPAAPFAGILATGATTGATTQAQTFTNGIVGPSWKPASDSTTALQLQNAAGTAIVTVDTTTGNTLFGSRVPTATATPLVVSFGGTYGNNVPGSEGNLKWKMYDDGNSDWTYGIGMSSGLMEFQAGSNAGFSFFPNRSTNAALTIRHTGTNCLLTSAATDAVTNVVNIGHDSSGTAAAGFGAGLAFALESSTTAAQSAARIQALWNDATHATRKADLILSAYDTAEREGLRIRGDGAAAAIGFLGATPAARIAHVADAVTVHAITDPGDAPADADALREDLVTNVIPSIESALNALGTKINNLLTTVETFGLHAT